MLVRSCDICGTLLDGVQRYSMQHKRRSDATHDVAEGKSSLSMGGIDICDQCWVTTAEPRMREYIVGIRECDLCRSDDTVLRLTLKQSRREGAKVRDQGRGSLALCLDCWRRIGLPKMRRKVDSQTDPVRVFILNAHRHR